MAKEEDFSFRSVLYRVISGHEPPQLLLDHPEFQRRVSRFCKGIDRNERKEDLCAASLYAHFEIRPPQTSRPAK